MIVASKVGNVQGSLLSMNTHRFWLVVPAAGIGQRMQSTVPKQYLTLADRFVLDVTLSRLLAALGGMYCTAASG